MEDDMTADEITRKCAEIERDIENGDRLVANSNGNISSYLASIAFSMSAMAKCELVMIKDTHLRLAEDAERQH